MTHRRPRRRRLGLPRGRPTLWSLLVPMIAVLAGLIFTISSQAARGTDLRSEAAGMPDLIREGTIQNSRRTAEIGSLRAQVQALTKEAAPGNDRIRALNDQADGIAAEAGVAPVMGPAVKVSLDDSPMSTDQLPDWANVDDIVVHQQDVQAVVNALWRGGAEAMMLMDQRVISTSAVRCVGNTLILQGRVYSPPFVVTALGDPEVLVAALEDDPAVDRYREYVDALGLGYEVDTVGEQTFPGFAGSLTLDTARVPE